MKRLVLTTGLFAILASGLHAQTMNLRANIPFDFQIGENRMPAGEYLIHHNGNALIVQGQSSRPTSVFAFSHSANRPDAPALGELVFKKYGDTYFLSQVWTPDSAAGRELSKGSRERELASRTGFVQSASVPARR